MHALKGKWIAISLMSGCAVTLPGVAFPVETIEPGSAAAQDNQAGQVQEALSVFHLADIPAGTGAAPANFAAGAMDAAVIADTGAGAIGTTAPAPFHDWVAVDSTVLDEMRGGFDIGPGLKVSFGIERIVNLNGVLQTMTRIEVPDAVKLTQSQQALAPAPAPAGTASAVATNAAAVAAQAVETAAAAADTTAARTATAAPAATPAATSNATAAPVATNLGNGTAALIQNGAGNSFSPVALPQTAGATFIQNSVNNQTIQSLTIINAATNSLELLKGANLQSTLLDAITQSAGTR